MFNKESLKLFPYSYPILKTDEFIDSKKYIKLKRN